MVIRGYKTAQETMQRWRERERESWRESMTDNDPIAESVSGYHAGVEGNLR